MYKYLLNLAFMLVSGLLVASSPAYGESHPFDFHINAKMQHKHHGPVDKAYGLVSINTDNHGNGIIDVMFSNGSQIDWAKFNAHIKFLNASASVIKEEHIYRWLDAAGEDGATERKVSKLVTISGFESIEVDFYLTDMPESGIAESSRKHSLRVSSVGLNF